jgi:hypothetical protein
VLLTAVGSDVQADDRLVGDASLPYMLAVEGWGPFDYFVRVDALTDLVERGISRTRHQPTARGETLIEIGNFYLSGAAYRLDNSPAGPKSQWEGEVEVGYEKRWTNLLVDLSASYELAGVNAHSGGTAETNVRARYDLSRSLALTGFVGYSPYDDKHQILFGGGGLRLKLRDDVVVHGQLGWSHYFDGVIDDYAFWRAGIDYYLNQNISLGAAYTDSTLSKSDCALVAESHSSHSCGASVIGRLTFKLYREDIEAPFGRDAATPANGSSSESPPLDVLSKKLPRTRSTDDNDED